MSYKQGNKIQNKPAYIWTRYRTIVNGRMMTISAMAKYLGVSEHYVSKEIAKRKYILDHKDCMSINDIAVAIREDYNRVWWFINKRNLSHRLNKPRVPKEQYRIAMECLINGCGLSVAVERSGISSSAIQNHYRKIFGVYYAEQIEYNQDKDILHCDDNFQNMFAPNTSDYEYYQSRADAKEFRLIRTETKSREAIPYCWKDLPDKLRNELMKLETQIQTQL